MGVLIGLITLLMLNILALVLPALLAAWLFTLVLPVPFDQVVWLSVGMLVVVRYVVLNLADIPGATEVDFVGAIVAAVLSLVLLALSGLCGWLLLRVIPLDLTIFEAILLFAISLAAGFYFTARSGTGGLPGWMTIVPGPDYEVEDDDMIIPPKRPRKRRRQTSR